MNPCVLLQEDSLGNGKWFSHCDHPMTGSDDQRGIMNWQSDWMVPYFKEVMWCWLSEGLHEHIFLLCHSYAMTVFNYTAFRYRCYVIVLLPFNHFKLRHHFSFFLLFLLLFSFKSYANRRHARIMHIWFANFEKLNRWTKISWKTDKGKKIKSTGRMLQIIIQLKINERFIACFAWNWIKIK